MLMGKDCGNPEAWVISLRVEPLPYNIEEFHDQGDDYMRLIAPRFMNMHAILF